MLREPQKLGYNERETLGPCVAVYFQDVKTSLSLPVEKVIDAALNALKSSGTESYYRYKGSYTCIFILILTSHISLTFLC